MPRTRVRYLPRMLDDPVRSVRIEAARALAGPTEARIAAADRDAFAKALAEYVAVQTYNADRPGRADRTSAICTRRAATVERAIAESRKALEIDPTSVAGARESRRRLSRARRRGRSRGRAARRHREDAARRARCITRWGFRYVRQKRQPTRCASSREAAKLAPDNARYAYVYAVALNDGGRTKEALQVLTAALKGASVRSRRALRARSLLRGGGRSATSPPGTRRRWSSSTLKTPNTRNSRRR